METENLMKLYELAVNEEHYYVDAHQDRIAFYMGLITAIVAAIGAGLLQASEWYHFAALCIGPALIFVVSKNARSGITRFYQRFLETVTIRAKIEQELGLTQQSSSNLNATHLYWASEPIIAPRHVNSRRTYESSETFVKEHLKKGYHSITMRLFGGFQWLSIPIFIGLLALAIWTAL
jgi:hypothetical protein